MPDPILGDVVDFSRCCRTYKRWLLDDSGMSRQVRVIESFACSDAPMYRGGLPAATPIKDDHGEVRVGSWADGKATFVNGENCMCTSLTKIRNTAGVSIVPGAGIIPVGFDQVDVDQLGIAADINNIVIKKHGWYRFTQAWQWVADFSDNIRVNSIVHTSGPGIDPLYDVAELDNECSRCVTGLVEMFPGDIITRDCEQLDVITTSPVTYVENVDSQGLTIELVRELPAV